MNQRLIYTTPEFLLKNKDMKKWIENCIQNQMLARIVLDEAHCVLEWGYDFRPAYLELAAWKRSNCPGIPMSLLTATISDEGIGTLAGLFDLVPTQPGAIEDYTNEIKCFDENKSMKNLSEKMILVQQVFDRINLDIQVIRKHENSACNAAYIAKICEDRPTVVYCLTKRETEQAAMHLIRAGCRAGIYHAGMTPKRREYMRKQWMAGNISIICATSAFGVRPASTFSMNRVLITPLTARDRPL